MKANKYKVVSRLECSPGCPAVVEHNGNYLIIGRLLSNEEANNLLANAEVGIDAGEVAIEIPGHIFMEAAEKQVAQTA